MKHILIFIALLLAAASALADPPRIDRRISGLFVQQFKNESFAYIVDPYAQLCFVSNLAGGITEIDCDALRRRGGWDNVIRWSSPDVYAPLVVPPAPPQ